MIIFEHSTYDASNIENNLGVSEYSYWFVRKAFRPALERFGALIPVRDPAKEVKAICDSLTRYGIPSIFFSFNPPHCTPVDLDCPTIPVFAWEFDTIPSQGWHEDERNNWTGVLRSLPAAITHSTSTVEAVQKSTGPEYPIWSIPAPIYEAKIHYAGSALGWRERHGLSLSTGLVFDTWGLDLALFSPGRSAASVTHIFNRLYGLTKGASGPITNISLRGVVYTSVFNPVDGRKNWEYLVSGFIWAFREQQDATLILKLAHWNLEDAVHPILKHIARHGAFKCRILVIHGMLSQGDYEQVLEATSYAVNTSTGEGQCLPLMEFMAAGRPAVAPRHTAMIDYVDASNAFIVPAHERPAFWPHDARHALTCHRYQVEFSGLVRCYQDSYLVARDSPERYASMSVAASEAQRRYCSIEIVTERLRNVIGHVVSRYGHSLEASQNGEPDGV